MSMKMENDGNEVQERRRESKQKLEEDKIRFRKEDDAQTEQRSTKRMQTEDEEKMRFEKHYEEQRR